MKHGHGIHLQLLPCCSGSASCLRSLHVSEVLRQRPNWYAGKRNHHKMRGAGQSWAGQGRACRRAATSKSAKLAASRSTPYMRVTANARCPVRYEGMRQLQQQRFNFGCSSRKRTCLRSWCCWRYRNFYISCDDQCERPHREWTLDNEQLLVSLGISKVATFDLFVVFVVAGPTAALTLGTTEHINAGRPLKNMPTV